MKIKRLIFCFFCVLIVGTGLHVCSPNRDLEVALGSKELPSSITEKKIESHVFTDYSVWAYFHIDPKDFDKLLSLRPYEKVELPKEMEMTAAQMFPLRMGKIFPELPEFEVADVYRWQVSESQTHCTLWTNMSHSIVFLMYGTD